MLRRCRSVLDVAFCPAFHALRLELRPFGRTRDEALAVTAGVLAHVREDAPGPGLAERMAKPTVANGNAPVSGLRFRRLLKIGPHQELYPMLVRMLALVDRRVDVAELAGIVYAWGPGVRKNLAYRYYEHAPNPNDMRKP